MLTPARRRGVEILDDPTVDAALRVRSIADVTRSNRVLGGLRAALIEVRAARANAAGPLTLLDVGSGLADIPQFACAEAQRAGYSLTTIAVDEAASLLAAARERIAHAVCANALFLPFEDASVDVVMCSQLLHHFDDAGALRLLAELNRVARRAVIVSDLRRSWIAAAGFWLVSFPLGFHRITRHDGVVSVLRGFTPSELAGLVRSATGARVVVRRRLGFRITVRWTPSARVSAA
ncbi:MAG: methyltransferase domain-containing protein [Gemmatimonadaceae bacterium]